MLPAAPAAAQAPCAPQPGLAAVEQYCEAVPGPGGPIGPAGPGRDRDQPRVPAEARRELARDAEGRELLSLAERTGEIASRPRGTDPLPSPSQGARSGGAFVALLVAMALALASLGIAARRRRGAMTEAT
jgi:hypothetical protein